MKMRTKFEGKQKTCENFIYYRCCAFI